MGWGGGWGGGGGWAAEENDGAAWATAAALSIVIKCHLELGCLVVNITGCYCSESQCVQHACSRLRKKLCRGGGGECTSVYMDLRAGVLCELRQCAGAVWASAAALSNVGLRPLSPGGRLPASLSAAALASQLVQHIFCRTGREG